jgi:hypothetical protein
MVVLVVRRVPSDRRVRYVYELRPDDTTLLAPLERESSVDLNEEMVDDLCRRIEEVAERTLDPDASTPDAARELRDFGKLLHNVLFPPENGSRTLELAAGLRGASGPLLVSTDEPRIPWELLYDGEQFLGLRHDLGRQLVIPGRPSIQRPVPLSPIARALLVADPLNDLPKARSEAERVRSWLHDHGTTCTLLMGEQADRLEVLRELSSGDYDLFHYSGHVATPPRSRRPRSATWSGEQDGGPEPALLLHGRKPLQPQEIRSTLGGGSGSPPVVFINGCASGEPFSNLCATFMATGAALVVGTLYRVSEEAAAGFAEQVYAGLLAGRPAGQAVRQARLALYESGDGGWAAFVYHGDPSARLELENAPARHRPAEAAERPAQRLHGLHVQPDREALAMLERVAQRAAPRGIVTSLDLLVELLAPGGAMRLAADRRGVAGAALAEQVLQVVLGLTGGAGPPARVPLSDTVARVLDQAADLAAATGRGRFGTSDIAEAFVGIGGGTSARVLELCGVPLQDLRPVEGHDKPPAEAPRSIFADDGRLRLEYLEPVTVLALQAAALLAATEGSVVSSAVTLIGLGLADSQALRAVLEAQSGPGREAVERLLPGVLELSARTFSRRVRRALDQALAAEQATGAQLVGEAAVLDALLADDEATARALLEQFGIDVGRLLADLRQQRPAGRTDPGQSRR